MEDIFANLVVDMSGEKILKTELLTRGQKKRNCGVTTVKKLLQPQDLILLLPK